MSLDFPNIIPECYVDTNLIEYLMHGTVNHQHSCNKVVGVLNGNFKDRFAVGIVDLDKKSVGYLSECEKIASSSHLSILKHVQRHHYMITIEPAVDRFLLDCAQELVISPKAYGLPSKLKDFLIRTKTINSNKDDDLRRLIAAISQSREVDVMQKTLRYLCEKTYESNVNDIKEFWTSPEDSSQLTV